MRHGLLYQEAYTWRSVFFSSPTLEATLCWSPRVGAYDIAHQMSLLSSSHLPAAENRLCEPEQRRQWKECGNFRCILFFLLGVQPQNGVVSRLCPWQ